MYNRGVHVLWGVLRALNVGTEMSDVPRQVIVLRTLPVCNKICLRTVEDIHFYNCKIGIFN